MCIRDSNGSISWKGVTVSAMFQGVAKRDCDPGTGAYFWGSGPYAQVTVFKAVSYTHLKQEPSLCEPGKRETCQGISLECDLVVQYYCPP